MPVAISSPIPTSTTIQDAPVEPPLRPPSAEAKTAPFRQPIARSPREIGFGILSHLCRPELVDCILAECGRSEQRLRLLPARLMVYAIILMCLKPTVSYQKLMYQLALAVPASYVWSVPNRSAFAQARKRLGWQVMERLFRSGAQLLAKTDSPGCWWRQRRVMAIDGTTIELANKPVLWKEFGGQTQEQGRQVGAPQLRVLSLIECGTRAIVDIEFGPYAEDEHSLAQALARSASSGMLTLADRNFLSVRLWQRYLEAGSDLLWRVKSSVAVRVLQHLDDGSYLARLGSGEDAVTVRVIEYAILGSDEIYRLVTNLLDPLLAPALELAHLYTERWEQEIVFRELKVFQCASRPLRSLTPNGVRQEFWAHMLAYNLSRRLVYQAALASPKRDPDRICFSLAQDLIRISAQRPSGLKQARLAAATRDAVRILSQKKELISRRNRACPRVVRFRQPRFPSRANLLEPASSHRLRRPPIFTLQPLQPIPSHTQHFPI
jgi:hypothetical protein